MLKNIKELKSYKVMGKDKDKIGKVEDFYFKRKDKDLSLEYIVVNPKRLLERKNKDRIIIPKNNLDCGEKDLVVEKIFSVDLGKEEAQKQFKVEEDKVETVVSEKSNDYLKNTEEIIGAEIHMDDDTEDVYQLKDFYLEEKNWNVPYFVIKGEKTRFSTKQALIPKELIKEIDLIEKQIKLNVSSNIIQNAPDFDYAIPLERTYEEILCDYYKIPGHWSKEE